VSLAFRYHINILSLHLLIYVDVLVSASAYHIL